VTVTATELENSRGTVTTSIDIPKDYRCDIHLFLHFQDKSAELTGNLKTHLLRFVSFSGGFICCRRSVSMLLRVPAATVTARIKMKGARLLGELGVGWVYILSKL